MFSVLIANYNNEKYINHAIKSVKNQILDDWELIVFDDASSDDSVEIIKKELTDNRISFYENKKNEGYIAVLKKMIAVARGDVVVILDGDDVLHKEALKGLKSVYDKNFDCGFVYTQCYYCDETLKPLHQGFSQEISENKSNLHLNVINALRSFKKNAYNKTAGYDDDYIGAEDVDLNFKLEEVTKVCFLDKPLYFYRVQKQSATHGQKNIRINRSSTALAKLNAYKRRIGTDIPNLSRVEVSEVLFWGMINAVLAMRLKLFLKFKMNLFLIYPIFLFDPRFYILIYRKIKKIKKLKKEKPLLQV